MREQTTLINIWEKSILIRGNSTCELPEAGAPLLCWRTARMGMEPVGERPCEVEGVQVGGSPDPAGLITIVKTQAFTPSEIRIFLKSSE